MKAVRSSQDKWQNMLDLGPLHQKVQNHIKAIIDNPELLIGQDAIFSTVTLNGQEFENEAVMAKVLQLSSTLPHLRAMLVSFFEGASTTWEHFTSEFAPGGIIDEATSEEKDLAWLPATNDENEGALGTFRQFMRRQPQLTLLNHNAAAMFCRNNTHNFIAAKFTEPKDYMHLRHLVRDTGGEERKRRKELVEFREKRQAEKTARKKRRDQLANERIERLAELQIQLDRTVIPNLKGQALKDQLRLFKQEGAPNLQTGRLPTLVNQIKAALLVAIDAYLSGEWKIWVFQRRKSVKLRKWIRIG